MNYQKIYDRVEDLKDKRIIITGATSGIGFEFAKDCLFKNASITLLVRDLENGEITKQRLLLDFPNANIELIQYDQSSYQSIEHAIDEINKRYSDFDYLVCNAGVLNPTKTYRTSENYPLTIGVNYFGVIHLIEYLSKTNKNHHRIVVQGSIVAGIKIIDNLDVYSDKYNYFTQYNFSKALIESKIYSFVENNTFPNLEFVITEPGISPTRITRNFSKFTQIGGKYFLMMFNLPKSASKCLLLAISKESKNGDYIVPSKLFTLKGTPKISKFPIKRYQKDKLI